MTKERRKKNVLLTNTQSGLSTCRHGALATRKTPLARPLFTCIGANKQQNWKTMTKQIRRCLCSNGAPDDKMQQVTS